MTDTVVLTTVRKFNRLVTVETKDVNEFNLKVETYNTAPLDLEGVGRFVACGVHCSVTFVKKSFWGAL